MLCCKWMRKAAFAGLLAVAAPFAAAQEPIAAPAPTTAEALIKRLEEAEARIKSLEGDLKAAPALDDQKQPVAGAAADAKPTAAADADKRLKKLEDDYKKDKDAAKKKADDDKKKPSVRLSGRIHLDAHWPITADPYIDAIENGNTNPAAPQAHYFVRRARIAADGDITDSMLYKIEMEFANPNNPQFRDLFIGFKNLPYNNSLIVGNQKKPLGLESLTSSRYLQFIERSLIDELENPDQRRPGVMLNGYSDCENFGWSFGAFSLNDWNTLIGTTTATVAGTSVVTNVGASSGEFYGNSPQWSLNGRFFGSPWYDDASDGRGYLHLGVAGQYADPDEDLGTQVLNPGYGIANQTRFRSRPEFRTLNRFIDSGALANAFQFNTVGLEAAANYGSFNASAEFFRTWVDRVGSGTQNDPCVEGWYVAAGYFITGEHRPYNRQRGIFDRVKPHQNFFLHETCCDGVERGLGAIEVAARYSVGDVTDLTPVTPLIGGVARNSTFGVNWYFNPYAKLQFNYVVGAVEQGPTRVITRPGLPNQTLTNGDWTGFATRLAIEF